MSKRIGAKTLWLCALLLLGIVSLACGNGSSYGTATQDAGYKSISSEDLAQMLKSKNFYMVNVHTPYAGEIEGTDAKIPYDEVEKRVGEFPRDKTARMVVYCSSGSMSRTASQTLVRLGYTNILDLTGGMGAWEKAGFKLIKS